MDLEDLHFDNRKEDSLQYKVADSYSIGGGRLGCSSPNCREGPFSETF